MSFASFVVAQGERAGTAERLAVAGASAGAPWCSTSTAHDAVVVVAREAANQATKFTYRQQFVQRVLSIALSTTSIVFCLAALYLFLAIDPRRLVFRHHLILFLICYDLLKAIILLIYPSRVLTDDTSYYSNKFCQVMGFFTATAIEGADFAILAFAVHTFMLIFKTQFTVRLDGHRVEGGLYLYRYYVYVLLVLIPLVLASLAYVKGVGYASFVCWCLLPLTPLWYRLVLLWLPRYLIVITIFTVYCMIYFHVIREFKTLGGVFKTMHTNTLPRERLRRLLDRPTFFSALRYAWRSLLDNFMPKFVLPGQDDLEMLKPENSERWLRKVGSISSDIDPAEEKRPQGAAAATGASGTWPRWRARSPPGEGSAAGGRANNLGEGNSSEDFNMMNPNLYGENLENFRKRQKIIQKQMKSIFIYPVAYIFLWLFPFVLYVTQIRYEQHNPPIYWLNCMGAFMQPLNGFVDSLVFFYREVPWEYTIFQNFKKEHSDRIGGLLISAASNVVGHDVGSIATSAKMTKQSISMSMAINLSELPRWRRWMHHMRMPFFALPSEDNVSRFQTQYVNDQIGHSLAATGGGSHDSKDAPTTLNNAHDFSNILSSDANDRDFRSALEQFSMNFSQKRTSMAESKRASQHSKRHDGELSADPHRVSKRASADPTIPAIAIDAKSPISEKSEGSDDRTVLGTPVGAASPAHNDEEMDFLLFLKNGPPS